MILKYPTLLAVLLIVPSSCDCSARNESSIQVGTDIKPRTVEVGESVRVQCFMNDRKGQAVEGGSKVVAEPAAGLTIQDDTILAERAGKYRVRCASQDGSARDPKGVSLKVVPRRTRLLAAVIDGGPVVTGKWVPVRCVLSEGGSSRDVSADILVPANVDARDGSVRASSPGYYPVACRMDGFPTTTNRTANLEVVIGSPGDIELFLDPPGPFYSLDDVVRLRWQVRDGSGNEYPGIGATIVAPEGAVSMDVPNTFRLTRYGHMTFFATAEGPGVPKDFPLRTSVLAPVVERQFDFMPLEPDLDVPYVSTIWEVVDVMLELAKVRPDDIVYDLGCGDGRLVVSAVARHGARGVGVDLDARRIKDSRETAMREGVTERVRFLHADLFHTEFSEATVLLMYLLPEVNLTLRPLILRNMKPGSRIVSHDFDMGDWEPDAHNRVQSDEYGHEVFYWVVPAWVEGTWEGTADVDGRKVPLKLTLSQRYQFFSGRMFWGDKEVPIEDGARLNGATLEFQATLPWQGRSRRVHVTGTVNGETLEATITPVGTRSGKGAYTANAKRTEAPPLPTYALDRKTDVGFDD
jgi:SAM-dependent methyltransferase